MNGSNADSALHMEGRHSDFGLHMERRNSFREQIVAQAASFANFQRKLFKATNILRVNMTYVTTFEIKNTLRESTFNDLLKTNFETYCFSITFTIVARVT